MYLSQSSDLRSAVIDNNNPVNSSTLVNLRDDVSSFTNFSRLQNVPLQLQLNSSIFHLDQFNTIRTSFTPEEPQRATSLFIFTHSEEMSI